MLLKFLFLSMLSAVFITVNKDCHLHSALTAEC